MRVALTGTPGTGKTTAANLVRSGFEVVHLNGVIREEGLTESVDDERDSLVADLGAVEAWLDDHGEADGDTLVESHLAHLFDADRVVVLRCEPDELERRLLERGETDAEARENAESEALDVILAEAVERHGEERVYEVVTTGRTPDAVARDVESVLAGERPPSAGTVDYTDWLVEGGPK